MPSGQAKPSESESQASERLRLPDWSGQTAVCIATGPSLTEEQIRQVYRTTHPVIAINEGGLAEYEPLAAPWSDILYAADQGWWYHYRPKQQPGRLHISGEPCPGVNGGEGVDTIPLNCIEPGNPMPHSVEPVKRDGVWRATSVVSGGHSGFQALGLALQLGAERVILLGYDCGGGPVRNCHADRPDKFKRDVNMEAWIQSYARVPREWPDRKVINCGRYSKIDAFEKRNLEDAL